MKKMKKKQNNTLIIGVGNEFRSDDGVGIWIVRKLKALHLPDVTILEAEGDGTKMMEAWKEFLNVMVFDAVLSPDDPGTTYRFDVNENDIPKNVFRHSTHAFGLREAVELSRSLHQLPPRLTIFGINGKTFRAGTGLSPEVEKSAHTLLQKGLDEIHARNSIV